MSQQINEKPAASIDDVSESLYKPFCAMFDKHMVDRHYGQSPLTVEDIVKGYAKACHIIEMVIGTAGASFEKTYNETRINLKNGQPL